MNNGTITGTTNVYYGATVQGTGSFGQINLFDGGTLFISPTASQTQSLVFLGGGIIGVGRSAQSVTFVSNAALVALNPADQLVLSGNLGGAGSVTKLGAGTVVLDGSDSYTGGTDVAGGTLIATSSQSLPDGGRLTVGAGATLIFDPSVSGSPVNSSNIAVATVSPVPEPGTLILLTVAVCGTAAYRRLRSRLKKV